MEEKDKRIKVLSEVLNGIKVMILIDNIKCIANTCKYIPLFLIEFEISGIGPENVRVGAAIYATHRKHTTAGTGTHQERHSVDVCRQGSVVQCS